jgi:hypothetical protein
MGSEYPGWRVRIGAACAFPLFMIFSPPHHGAWLLVPWWYLLTGLIVLHLFLGWKSEAAHSHYIGDSLAWRWNANWRTQGKRILPEFWLSMGLACLLAFLCDTVGKFVAFSGICSTVSLLLMRFRDQKIAQRMRNQQLDAEYYGHMFHSTRGDRS